MIKARDVLVAPCALADIRSFVETHHYSRNLNGVKILQCFSVTAADQLVGAVVFGAMSTTAWKKYADREEKVVELRRLVLLDSVGRNGESRVIGWTLRWLKKHKPRIDIVVSYADPMYGHTGIIYRAANFTYLGISSPDKGYRDKETGKVYHSRALRTKYKGDYKPFVKRLRAKLAVGELEPITLLGKHCFTYQLRKK